MKTKIIHLIVYILNVRAQLLRCDFFQALKINSNYEFFSPEFKIETQARNENCRWAVEAPSGYKVSLKCDYVFIFPLIGCSNKMTISKRGRKDLADGESYCGHFGPISKESLSTRMSVGFKTGLLPMGSRIHCTITAVIDSCVCGKQNTGKIVGGNETAINEYPSMAGLTDGKEGIVCGSTIISSTAAVSAAHCFSGRIKENMRLLVGEHDFTKTTETLFTKSHIISRIVQHENFNSETNDNDIALVYTEGFIIFNDGVGPSCLPIAFRKNNLLGRSVMGVGWGTTEFGGPRSPILLKVNLDIVENSFCNEKQICSYATNKDFCTYDSGGPLFMTIESITYNIGIVSYGIACATKTPAANTRLTYYLDWILSQTKSTVYCVKIFGACCGKLTKITMYEA